MLSPACSFWDISYLLCTYTSIFIILLIAWQIRRTYQRLSLEPKKSYYRHHRKVRQSARDAASRARRLSREEAEKPWELLSIMQSQSWLPKEGNVRQLLCIDPGCQICEAATLEIQQLLQSEKSQLSPALLGLPQDSAHSAHLEMLPMSFEQNMELRSRHTRHLPLGPENQTLTQLTEHLTELTNTVGVQEYWTDHLQLDEKFHLANMPMVSETMASSGLKEPMVLMIKEKIMQSKTKLDQESQELHRVTSSVSLLSLDPKIPNLTHTMSLRMDSMLSSHLPLLSPKVRGLLELHVKKWIHFQKWGLPRRVEESLRQLMPDPTLFCRSRENQSSCILNSSSKDTKDKTGIISHKTNSLYLVDQPIQTFWVSEWPVINLKQGKPWHQIHTCLPSHEAEHLRNFYSLPEAKANDSGDNSQSEYYSQLFCGLPSLHSESLDVTSLSFPGICKKKTTSKPSTDPSGLSLPKTPRESALPSSPTSPNGKTPYEHEGAQMAVPFLTLAECEALERHLLEKQLKFQWGLPALLLQNQYTQSRMSWEAHAKAKTVKTFLAKKPISYSTKESFPEHARRLLEFHLQKRLIHLRWGLPQRIQHSIHMLFSSTDQQSLSCIDNRLPNMSISQPGQPEADGSGDMFSPIVGKGSIPMPHLFAEAREMLKSHVDFKCEQIHEGKIPAQVWSSWECRIPGSLATMAPFPWIPQGQCRKLQAESKSDLNLHHKIVSWKPKALSQETQALSGALFEHCKRPQALSEETIKKLETTLHHKYLAFLSGLPALYCVALSRPVSPAVTSQPRLREKIPRPIKNPSKTLTQITPLEPCIQEDSVVSADIVQADGRTEKVPPESQSPQDRPYSLNTHILAKLNFHLKKKVLAMQFGISEKERKEYKENTAGLESESIQEFLRSLHIPESRLLQEHPVACPSPPAPNAKRFQLKKQAAPAIQAVSQEQKQLTSKAMPQSPAQQGSKASQFHRDMMKTQVCVNMDAGRKKYNLEKPQTVGDLGEGDAGLGLSLVSQKTHQDGEQEPERQPLHRPQGSSQQGHNFHLEAVCPHSHPEPPELEFPDPPSEVFMETDSEQDTEDSQSEEYIVLEPARIPEVPQPVVCQASQGLPFPCSPIQRKPFQGQTCPSHFSPGHMMPASPYTKPGHLPETGLKNKMKFFFHSINPKIKSKTHSEPSMVSTPGKVAKTSKENVERGPSRTKIPIKRTKSEDSRGPKAQSSSSEKSVITSLLTAPHILDSKLCPHSRQLGPVSMLGNSRHCPRHCPRLAYATQHRNQP
ncbi:spermatogenesis-associated protein 31F1B-like [Arvicanthis niloticus]|uniref:spermatogenesis-associated protein 31F1B-like n=1 Tax=Arvicanthis niloticus TaxID=61156 RepID=UPI001485E835|nr:protein FAM205A-2-like [Arvicanthis niloticus]